MLHVTEVLSASYPDWFGIAELGRQAPPCFGSADAAAEKRTGDVFALYSFNLIQVDLNEIVTVMATSARSPYRLVLALLLSLAPTSLLASAGPRAQLTTGTIEGFYNGTLEVFLGVPFATPPVGDLRFRAPEWPASHEGVLETKTWSDACMQIPAAYSYLSTGFSEDCLGMNIWRSGPATPQLLPVLFWIHGGAYMNGASSVDLYIPYNLLDYANKLGEPFIFVSANYRLNGFGFLAHPSMSESDNNAGLLDQLQALRFLKANAVALGADPEKASLSRQVTVWGQPAGAGSIATHILFSNPAEGLFRAAVMTSGNHIAGPVQVPKLAEVSVGSLPPIYNATRCSDLECLREANVTNLFTGISSWINTSGVIQDRLPFPNVLGGYISELPSVRLATTSRAGSLPTLMTQVTDEGTVFTTPLLGTTPTIYEGDEYITDTPAFSAYNNYHIQNSTFVGLDQLYPVNDTSLLSPYGTNGTVLLAPGVPISPYIMRTTAMTGDLMSTSPRRSWLDAAISRGKEGKRQWSYRYNQRNPTFPAWLGVYHVSDLFMLFGQYPSTGNSSTDASFAALSQDMQRAMINFVNNLDPQVGYEKQKTLAWEPYYVAKRLLVLEAGNRTLEDDTFRKLQTDFIASVVPQLER